MVFAGALWVVASSAALVVGSDVLLGVSSNILVFYGFYLGWVRQTQDERELHQHEKDEQAQLRTEEQLEREVDR